MNSALGRITRYRLRVVPLFAIVAGTYWGLVLLKRLLPLSRGEAFVPIYTHTILFGTLLPLIAAFAIAILFRVTVTEKGIKGRTVWGVPKHLAWSRVSKVEERGLLGFRHMILKSNDGDSIWISTLLKGYEELQDIVERKLHPS